MSKRKPKVTAPVAWGDEGNADHVQVDLAEHYGEYGALDVPQGRQANAATVSAVVRSMREVGQLQPVLVVGPFLERGKVERYRLVDGLARVAACRELGHRFIMAITVDPAKEDAIYLESRAWSWAPPLPSPGVSDASVTPGKGKATCEQCGQPFEAQRSTARYCSGKCRMAAMRERAHPSEAAAAIGTFSDRNLELAALYVDTARQAGFLPPAAKPPS